MFAVTRRTGSRSQPCRIGQVRGDRRQRPRLAAPARRRGKMVAYHDGSVSARVDGRRQHLRRPCDCTRTTARSSRTPTARCSKPASASRRCSATTTILRNATTRFNMGGQRYYSFEPPGHALARLPMWYACSRSTARTRRDATVLARQRTAALTRLWKICMLHHPLYTGGRYRVRRLMRWHSRPVVNARRAPSCFPGTNISTSAARPAGRRLLHHRGSGFIAHGDASTGGTSRVRSTVTTVSCWRSHRRRLALPVTRAGRDAAHRTPDVTRARRRQSAGRGQAAPPATSADVTGYFVAAGSAVGPASEPGLSKRRPNASVLRSSWTRGHREGDAGLERLHPLFHGAIPRLEACPAEQPGKLRVRRARARRSTRKRRPASEMRTGTNVAPPCGSVCMLTLAGGPVAPQRCVSARTRGSPCVVRRWRRRPGASRMARTGAIGSRAATQTHQALVLRLVVPMREEHREQPQGVGLRRRGRPHARELLERPAFHVSGVAICSPVKRRSTATQSKHTVPLPRRRARTGRRRAREPPPSWSQTAPTGTPAVDATDEADAIGTEAEREQQPRRGHLAVRLRAARTSREAVPRGSTQRTSGPCHARASA